MSQINEAGLKLIKSFEGCKLHSYKDIVGIWTIGYGHVDGSINAGQTITQERADELLKHDLAKFEQGVTKLVKSKINDNQFSALVCFSYNVGLHALETSKLLRYVNDGDFKLAADEFPRWDKAGGVVVLGLLRRRNAERQLFLS